MEFIKAIMAKDKTFETRATQQWIFGHLANPSPPKSTAEQAPKILLCLITDCLETQEITSEWILPHRDNAGCAHTFMQKHRTKVSHHDKVISASPVMVGSTDTSGVGMHGACFIPAPWLTPERPNHCPYLWHQPHEEWTQDAPITLNNPQGTITNSDLKLMGTVAHHDMIATQQGAAELTIETAHNNYAIVIWNHKGCTSTTGPAACLLQL